MPTSNDNARVKFGTIHSLASPKPLFAQSPRHPSRNYHMLNIEQELSTLNSDWQNNHGTLQQTFQFKGFLKTMSFVNAVAWQANRLMHHPDMEISFNQCTIKITTHDQANSLTAKDFELAKSIEQLL